MAVATILIQITFIFNLSLYSWKNTDFFHIHVICKIHAIDDKVRSPFYDTTFILDKDINDKTQCYTSVIVNYKHLFPLARDRNMMHQIVQ